MKSIFSIKCVICLLFLSAMAIGCEERPDELTPGDFELTAVKAVNSMLEDGCLDKKDGSRYVVSLSRVINDTEVLFNTRIVTNKVRAAMMKSRKVTFTDFGYGEQADQVIKAVMAAKAAGRGNLATGPQADQTVYPQLVLKGEFISQKSRQRNGKVLEGYYFYLKLVDTSRRVSFWEDEFTVVKSNR